MLSDLVEHHCEVESLSGHLREQLVGVQALALAPDLAQQVAGLARRVNHSGPKRSRSRLRRCVSNAQARR